MAEIANKKNIKFLVLIVVIIVISCDDQITNYENSDFVAYPEFRFERGNKQDSTYFLFSSTKTDSHKLLVECKVWMDYAAFPLFRKRMNANSLEYYLSIYCGNFNPVGKVEYHFKDTLYISQTDSLKEIYYLYDWRINDTLKARNDKLLF